MKRFILTIIVPIVLLLSCKTEKQKSIIQYELEHNQCKVKGTITISEEPFYALDSMKILREKYRESKEYHLNQLNKSLTELQTEIKLKETESETIENNQLRNYFNHHVEQMKDREIQLKKNITYYQLQPEKTQLNVYLNELAQYAKDSNAIIALRMEASFKGTQGSLNPQLFNKQYLTPTNNSYILELNK